MLHPDEHSRSFPSQQRLGDYCRPVPSQWARRLLGLTAIVLAMVLADPAWSFDRQRSRPSPPSVKAVTLPPFCAGPTQVQGVEAYVCEVPVNWVFDATELAQFATSEIGVTIQAVGGRGGDGGSTLGGTVNTGSGGPPGLAQTTIRGNALSGKSLYIYVGNSGAIGAAGKGGNGGAATVVATQALSPKPSSLDGILLVAGGGGGGQGYTGATPPCILVNPASPSNFNPGQNVACSGGGGGVAIAIDEQNRIGMGRPSNLNLPVLGYKNNNLGSGQPAFFDAGSWTGGAAGSGGTSGSGAFSFAGAAAEGSPAAGTWVRETATLTLGTATVLGGNGKGSGGAGGGGVAGGGGAGNGGGAGGASFAVGSGYGLSASDSFPVPCETQGFCAQNWLSPAGTDQPVVVITFWLASEAAPTIPTDDETITTDQPSLVFLGEEASDASQGIYYVLEDTASQAVNYTGVINTAATGNLLWTVPGGILVPGQSYAWYTTDQAGNPLQDSQSFTVASDTTSSSLTQGWTLYVRSLDAIDTSLAADLQPLSNQPAPQVSTSCSCECTETLNLPAATPPSPGLTDTEYPSCKGFVADDKAGCTCTWSASGDKPTALTFWEWTPASGTGCTASSGSCYGNAQVTLGTIDTDWSSSTNPLNLQVPSRLINLTSEPDAPTNGTPVPSLAVPAITGYSGNCTDSQVEVTFTTQTNGGVRLQIWADPDTGMAASSPTTAIDYWDISSCSWKITENIPASSNSNFYSIEFMEAEVYVNCQASIEEQTGTQSFCLTPETPYRVRFDAVVPYLPGPMRLGFKLAGMDSSAPLPANWISTCTLDGTTQNCDAVEAFLNEPLRLHQPFGHLAPGQHQAHRDRRAKRDRPTVRHRRGSGRRHPPVVNDSISPDEGTNGADSCIALGSAVQCVWKANGTWELPWAYTQDDGWVVIQALGGAGGAGYPPAINLGGAGGRAQAVIPADSLAGETLYLYVGENGADEENFNCQGMTDGCFTSAAGGAASMVTTTPVPDSFVSAGCDGGAEGLNTLAIAGGGGGGGINGKVSTVPSLGGYGGIAIGGSGEQNVIGTGTAGTADPSSYGGQAPAYGSNPYAGTQTVTGGAAALWWPGELYPSYGGELIAPGGAAGLSTNTPYAQTWFSNTSFLTLQTSNMQACSGGQSVDGGGGGGGHAGGGGGVSQIDEGAYNVGWENVYGAGGGGGSSWAAGAGAGITLPVSYAEWQYLTDESSSQVVVTVHCNSCGFEIPGLVQTIGHGYPDNNANFNDVAGVAWDSTNGHVLVIDGNWIKVFSAMNNRPNFSYVHTLGGNGFSSPQGVAWDDTNHRILVADTGNQRVQVLQPNGTVIGVFGNDILLSPSGIDWDSVNQRIVVTDEDVDSNLIYFFDANGNSLSSFKTPKNGAPSDVAWHGDTGYITDVENDVVWRCPDSGQGCVSIGQPGNGLNGTFSFPIGVAWDTTNERILVGNTSSGASGDIESVQAFDPNSRLLYSYSIDDFSTYIPAGVIGVEWAAAPAWLLIADPINNDIDVLYQWPD